MKAGKRAFREEMRAIFGADRGKTGVTGFKANPVEMKSVAVPEEVHEKHAVVKPVGVLRKRHRGRNLAAGRHGEPKELARGICGSWRKLAAACMKVSRHARVTWCKRNIMRNKWTRVKAERGIGRVRTLRERVWGR
jgi:hypothetical protein